MRSSVAAARPRWFPPLVKTAFQSAQGPAARQKSPAGSSNRLATSDFRSPGQRELPKGCAAVRTDAAAGKRLFRDEGRDRFGLPKNWSTTVSLAPWLLWRNSLHA